MSALQQARAHLGVAARRGTPEDVARARRALKLAHIDAHIDALADGAELLTDVQRSRLADLVAVA